MDNQKAWESMAQMFSALGDPTRLKLVGALMDGPKCVHELSELANISESAASHQLRTLRLLRLVTFQRQGQHIIYTLNDDHVYRLVEQAREHAMEETHE